MTRRRRARVIGAVALLTALGLAGCAEAVNGGAVPAASAPGPTSAVPEPTPAPTGSPASTTPAPFPTAADGSDVAACRDGNCEIVVSGPVEIPLEREFGVDRLAITAIAADGVQCRAETSRAQTLEWSVSTGQVYASDDGEIYYVEFSQLQAGSTASANQISLRVVALDGERAVLDFSPA